MIDEWRHITWEHVFILADRRLKELGYDNHEELEPYYKDLNFD